MYKSIAEDNNIKIEFIHSSDKLPIVADKNIINDIINNLVNNAIKFTKSGSVTINQSEFAHNDKYFVKIDVIDTGIGISEEEQKFIFDEFRQGSEGISRNYEGTGLGLTISQKYAHLINGDLSVKSKLGAGSTFTLILPIEKIEDSKNNGDNNISSTNSNVSPERRKTILYVEDDKLSIDFFTRILSKKYTVLTTRTCSGAVEIIADNEIDIIIMDINLGMGENGLEITKVIKEIPEYAKIPIVACTAYASETDKNHYLEQGCDDYLSKPYEIKDMLEIIKKWTE